MILKKPILRAAIYAATLLLAIVLASATLAEWNRAEALSATWYGPGFYGNKTASGEVYTGQDLTAASGHIPMGTVVEVTGPNEKKVPVRINDICACPLDLSEGAGEATGVKAEGRSEVDVQAIGTASAAAADSTASSGSHAEDGGASNSVTELPDTGAPDWLKEVKWAS